MPEKSVTRFRASFAALAAATRAAARPNGQTRSQAPAAPASTAQRPASGAA